MPVYEKCSMMIVPVTCDCKKKIAGMLGDYCDVMWDPPVITDNSFDGMIIDVGGQDSKIIYLDSKYAV